MRNTSAGKLSYLAHVVSENKSATAIGHVLHQTQPTRSHISPRPLLLFETEKLRAEMAHYLRVRRLA